MEIKKFNSAELKEFIHSEEFKNLKVIPITKHRALSHIHNPRVSPDDYILYLAYENKELVGYRVVMADKIFFNHQEFKIGWYSCVWVDPQMRGKGIAKALVNTSLKDWENKIVLVDPVKESKALYLQTGQFTDEIKLTGLRGYLKFTTFQIITQKIPSLKPLGFLFKIADGLLNVPNKIRLSFWKSAFKKSSVNIKYTTEIDNEVAEFIAKNNQRDLSKRNKRELEWITKFPWVIMSSAPDEDSQKYYFSSHSRQFLNLNIKLYDKDKLSAFLLISIRDGHLKIPFISLNDQMDMEKICLVIYHHLLKYDLSTFTVFNPEISDYIRRHHNPFITTKSIIKQFLFSKLFENYFLTNKVYIQDGEGDAAFT